MFKSPRRARRRPFIIPAECRGPDGPSAVSAATPEIAIVRSRERRALRGFRLHSGDEDPRPAGDPGARPAADMLASRFGEAAGYRPQIVESPAGRDAEISAGTVTFAPASGPGLPKELHLTRGPRRHRSKRRRFGFALRRQTLLQLSRRRSLRGAAGDAAASAPSAWTILLVRITDSPRFAGAASLSTSAAISSRRVRQARPRHMSCTR